MLREELHNLKNCQVTFLTYAVTATGVLLGLAVKLASFPSLGAFYLVPLTILLPFWLIFFDKATTITRIVGYYRTIEKAILEPNSIEGMVGWENGLARFRELQQKGKLKLRGGRSEKNRIICLFKLVFLQTAHPYWVLTYYVFFGLSVLCLALSLYTAKPMTGVAYVLPAIAAFMIMISAVRNAYIVWQLIWGRYSYTANEYFWREKILKLRDVQKEQK